MLLPSPGAIGKDGIFKMGAIRYNEGTGKKQLDLPHNHGSEEEPSSQMHYMMQSATRG